MNKIGLYRGAIAALVLLNILVLGYVYIGANHPGPGREMRAGGAAGPGGPDGGPWRMMVKRLKMDSLQQEQFRLMRTEHHSRLDALREERAGLHDRLFSLLKEEPVNLAAKDSIMQMLQQNELQQEQLTFDHFSQLRAILHEDQKPLFNDLVEDVGQQLTGPPSGR